MAAHDAFVLGMQLAMGFALAAACGLRAFLPLFAAGCLARAGFVSLGASFGWMESWPALLCFGSAVVFEIAGDKIPAVDHVLDAAGVVVKPAAATLLAGSLLTGMDPMTATVLALVTGGAVAGLVHVGKAKTRLGSSLFTGGIANPAISIAEDVLAFATVALAILLPLFAAGLVLLGFLGLWYVLRRLTRKPPGGTDTRGFTVA